MKITITGLPEINDEAEQQELGRQLLLAIYYRGHMRDGMHVEFEKPVTVFGPADDQ